MTFTPPLPVVDIQAVAQAWMRGEGVPMPKPAMGGRRGKAD